MGLMGFVSAIRWVPVAVRYCDGIDCWSRGGQCVRPSGWVDELGEPKE